VTLDRACSDEQRLCDLAVGEALAGVLGYAALAGCQRVDPCKKDAARAGAGGAELGLGPFGERSRARAMGGVESLAEELSRFGAPVAPPEQGAEIGEGTRSLQPCVTTLEGVDRLAEQEPSTLTAGHDAGGTHRHAERAWSPE
jgi:hypothetical protein